MFRFRMPFRASVHRFVANCSWEAVSMTPRWIHHRYNLTILFGYFNCTMFAAFRVCHQKNIWTPFFTFIELWTVLHRVGCLFLCATFFAKWLGFLQLLCILTNARRDLGSAFWKNFFRKMVIVCCYQFSQLLPHLLPFMTKNTPGQFAQFVYDLNGLFTLLKTSGMSLIGASALLRKFYRSFILCLRVFIPAMNRKWIVLTSGLATILSSPTSQNLETFRSFAKKSPGDFRLLSVIATISVWLSISSCLRGFR